MHWWEVSVPLVPDDGAAGVHIFTYVDTTPNEARSRAREDAGSSWAIRHRRGAKVDLSHMTLMCHTPDLRSRHSTSAEIPRQRTTS